MTNEAKTLPNLKREVLLLKIWADNALFQSRAADIFKDICTFITSHSEVLDPDSAEFTDINNQLVEIFKVKPNEKKKIIQVAKNTSFAEEIQFMEMILDIFSIDMNNTLATATPEQNKDSNISNSHYSQFGNAAFVNATEHFTPVLPANM